MTHRNIAITMGDTTIHAESATCEPLWLVEVEPPTVGQRRTARRRWRGYDRAKGARWLRAARRAGDRTPMASRLATELAREDCWESPADYYETMRGRRGVSGGVW